MTTLSTPTARLSVSVVTPTYRRPAEVAELVRDLALQELLPSEIVIVDGNPDEEEATARAVAAAVADGLPFAVHHVRSARGTAHQRNVGLDRAEGDLVALLDDDVRLEPDFLARMVEVFAADHDRRVGGVVGYRSNQHLGRSGRLPPRWRWYRRLRLLRTFEPGHYDRACGYPINANLQPPFTGTRPVDFMTTACAVWRREVFDGGLRFDPFFTDYGVLEDAELALRAGRSWDLLQCGDARCRELSAAGGRSPSRVVARTAVVNYWYVFQRAAGPLDAGQRFRFWRFQAFELVRVGAAAARRPTAGARAELLGRLDGWVGVARGAVRSALRRGVPARPTVLFAGPALGRNPGWVTTQGEILADRFAAEGWPVRETSTVVGRVGRAFDTARSIVRWRRDVDVAVVAVFSGPAFAIGALSTLLCRLLRIPVITVLRGGSLPTFAEQHRRWVRSVLRRSEAIVVPSSFLLPLAASVGRPVVTIPNVVDLDRYVTARSDRTGHRVLWMRTFHATYDPMLAIDAFERIRRTWPDATLTMAGQDKGMLHDVRKAIADRGLTDVVDLPGFLDPDAKSAMFASHDVFLNTNVVDNSPVSVLEAAAAGVPIVATAVGGVPELLRSGVDALLVPAGDAEAMAGAVDTVFTDADHRAELIRNGIEVAAASAWPPVRDAWISLFEAVASGAPTTTAATVGPTPERSRRATTG